MVQAIQEHIISDVDSDAYSPDWVLITGIADLDGTPRDEIIRLYRSPKTPDYTIYGLVNAIAIDFGE